MTTLKETAKPVTDLPYPAVTICSSGFHMSNVEKKIAENFAKWRSQNNRIGDTEEAIEDDIEEYMLTTFQIKSAEATTGTKPANIIDILDTMIAPKVESSVAANSVRENIFACKGSSGTAARKKRSNCVNTCTNPDFILVGSNCFKAYSEELNFARANSKCNAVGATLATITGPGDDLFLSSLMQDNTGYWIGLNDIEVERTFVWQDGSNPSYTNWQSDQPDGGDCVLKGKTLLWRDQPCNLERPFVCSMPAENPCESTSSTTTTLLVASVVDSAVNKHSCVHPENTLQDEQATTNLVLPDVDVFLNPAKKSFMNEVIKEKKEIAKNYFSTVDMKSLYPELFRILWESSLPCFKNSGNEEAMLVSCQLAGLELNCSGLFRKVPTDTGMCCALNILDPLKDSKYQQMMKELQSEVPTKTLATSEVGQGNGLRLTLDLHSNTISFGTIDQEYDAFNVFIGQPTEFPMMKERSLKVQPGREHFIDLSAVVVSAKDIKDITQEARNCFFADEGDLEFYESYTLSNCKLECAIKNSEAAFNCVPWHLPGVRFGNIQIVVEVPSEQQLSYL